VWSGFFQPTVLHEALIRMCLRGQLCKLVCKASRHHTLCKLATITITLQEQTRILRERQICQTSTLNHERVTRPPEAHPRSRCRGSGRAINIQDRAFWWKKKKHHYESTRRHAHTARRKIKLYTTTDAADLFHCHQFQDSNRQALGTNSRNVCFVVVTVVLRSHNASLR
jgi:hypothetical protein